MAGRPVYRCDGVKLKQRILHKVCHSAVKLWPSLCYVSSPVPPMLFTMLTLGQRTILRSPIGHSPELSFNTEREITFIRLLFWARYYIYDRIWKWGSSFLRFSWNPNCCKWNKYVPSAGEAQSSKVRHWNPMWALPQGIWKLSVTLLAHCLYREYIIVEDFEERERGDFCVRGNRVFPRVNWGSSKSSRPQPWCLSLSGLQVVAKILLRQFRENPPSHPQYLITLACLLLESCPVGLASIPLYPWYFLLVIFQLLTPHPAPWL